MMFLKFITFLLVGSAIADRVVDPLDPSLISCQSDRVTIRIPKTLLNKDHIGFEVVDSIYMVKNAETYEKIDGCEAVERPDENDYYFDLDLANGGYKCMTTDTDTSLNMAKFNIYFRPVLPGYLINSFNPKVNFAVTCIFGDLVGRKNPDAAIAPQKGNQVSSYVPVSKKFDVLVKFYENGFDQAAAEAKDHYDVTVGDRVNIGYELIDDYWQDLVLQAKSCWLSPYADHTKDPKVNTIEDWCKADDPLNADLTGMVKNSVDHKVHFYFSTFFWSQLKSSTIHVHCDLFVCSTKLGEDCTKTCNQRVRRSLNEDDESSEGKIVSFGPFNVTTKAVNISNVCKPEDYGCEQNCEIDDYGKSFCTCSDGYKLADDLKSCIFMQPAIYRFYQINRTINLTTKESSQLAAYGLFIFILILIIGIVLRKKQMRTLK